MRSHPAPVLAISIAIALTSALASGCSLTGLDQFAWPGCEQCDALNVRDGIDPENDCMLWQCSGENQTSCQLGPLDADGDTFIALRCGGDDCNDEEFVVHPGAEEQCNGLDDDCNDYIDDGSRPAEPATSILETTGTASWASYRQTSDALVMAYDTTAGAGIERVRDAAPITTGSIALELASTSPTYAITQEETGTGCAVRTSTTIPLPLCGAGDACPAGEECVDSAGGDRLCGAPISPTPPAGKCNTDAECDDGVFCNGVESCQPSSPISDPVTGCRAMVAGACTGDEVCIEEGRLCTDVGPSLTPCGIADVAVTPAGTEWIAAAVTTAGCGHGSLRVGYFTLMPRSPESRYPAVGDIALRGDRGNLRGASWTGIDVTADARCPGPENGRADGAPVGASGPSIAGLPARAPARLRPQALVAYVAGPRCRAEVSGDPEPLADTVGACGDRENLDAMGNPPVGGRGSVDIELVGLWLEEGFAGGAPVGWVNAASSGVPTRLGVRTSAEATRPQVLSWSADTSDAETAEGFLVAYPLEAGGIAVHVVPPMDDPAPLCDEASPVLPCVNAIAPHVTQLGTEPRTTPELVIPAATTIFADAEITGDVVMALHGSAPMPGEPLRLAFAWVEATQIAIALATLDAATGTVTAGRAVRVPATNVHDLAIAHVSRGMIGERLRDGTLADPALRGGFVATWTESTMARDVPEHVWAVRLPDAGDELLAPGAVRLTPDAPAPPRTRAVAEPYAFVDSMGELRVIAHVDESLVLYPSVCGSAR